MSKLMGQLQFFSNSRDFSDCYLGLMPGAVSTQNDVIPLKQVMGICVSTMIASLGIVLLQRVR